MQITTDTPAWFMPEMTTILDSDGREVRIGSYTTPQGKKVEMQYILTMPDNRDYSHQPETDMVLREQLWRKANA